MTVHQKINERQWKCIEHYLNSFLFMYEYLSKKEDNKVPKNQRWGGYRNTCYDVRGKLC